MDENPGKSMRHLSKYRQMSDLTMKNVDHQNIDVKQTLLGVSANVDKN